MKRQPPLTSPVSIFGRVGDGGLGSCSSSTFFSAFFSSGGRTLARACKKSNNNNQARPTTHINIKALAAVNVTRLLTFQAVPSLKTEGERNYRNAQPQGTRKNSKHVHTAIYPCSCTKRHFQRYLRVGPLRNDAARLFLEHRCPILSKVVRRLCHTALEHGLSINTNATFNATLMQHALSEIPPRTVSSSLVVADLFGEGLDDGLKRRVFPEEVGSQAHSLGPDVVVRVVREAQDAGDAHTSRRRLVENQVLQRHETFRRNQTNRSR